MVVLKSFFVSIDTSITKIRLEPSSSIVAMLKLAAEWTGASQCKVLCTACAIKVMLMATTPDMIHLSRWNRVW